jgi:AraC-like DNA-binding protein
MPRAQMRGNVVGDSVIMRAPTSALLLANLGRDHGVPLAVSLTGTGLRPADLRQPDGTVTGDQELVIIDNILDALGDPPGLGVEAGLRYHLTTYGIWGFALISSPTLREAVHMGLRYLELTYSYCRFTNRETREELNLRLEVDGMTPRMERFLIERDVAAIHVIQRELQPLATRLNRVTFAHAAPPTEHLATYQDAFGLLPRFNAAEHAAVFDGRYLDEPLPQAEQITADQAEAQCQGLLRSRRVAGNLADRVRLVLRERPDAPPTLGQVAAALHQSPRTVRRRLAAEGVSYRGLLAEVRESLAADLLRDDTLTVEEVAQRLGYAETASFTHAFRRWTGKGPRAHRQATALDPPP